jgi:hypothetical protein
MKKLWISFAIVFVGSFAVLGWVGMLGIGLMLVCLRALELRAHWYARSSDFLGLPFMQTLRWMRAPGDSILCIERAGAGGVRLRRPVGEGEERGGGDSGCGACSFGRLRALIGPHFSHCYETVGGMRAFRILSSGGLLMTVQELHESVAAKKAELDGLRPLPAEALSNLEHYYDLEITYTSNAIEGNTLGPVETTLVIEKGITISGKPLKDHLEALDHYDAMHYVRELARENTPITESDVRNLHRLVMHRSRPDTAGRYADLARYVRTETGRYDFPSPVEIPALMGDFSNWLQSAPVTPATAFTAHRRLVDVHPFNDGNGRTARLVMNLVLIRGGYPPVAVRPEDRQSYVAALQISQAGRGHEAFDGLLFQRLDSTLAEYLRAVRRESI